MNFYWEISDEWSGVLVDKRNTCIHPAHDDHAPIHGLVERSEGDDRTTKEEQEAESEFFHPEPCEVKSKRIFNAKPRNIVHLDTN